MRPRLFLLSICVLLINSRQLHAQSRHVYEDSSILYPLETEAVEEISTKVEAPAEENTYSNETTTIKDTLLIANRHYLSPDSVKALRNEKPFYYAGSLDSVLQELKKQREKPKPKEKIKEPVADDSSPRSSGAGMMEAFFNSKKTQYVLWGMAALFVLFVLYKLFFADGVFKKTTAKSKVKIVAEEEEAKPVQERKFDRAIAKAANENNYRMAVRYLYLQLLQRLTAAGAIEFAADKTNTEYLRELNGKSYKEEVASLTRYYDYVWYGEFAIDAAAYSKIENRFRNIVI